MSKNKAIASVGQDAIHPNFGIGRIMSKYPDATIAGKHWCVFKPYSSNTISPKETVKVELSRLTLIDSTFIVQGMSHHWDEVARRVGDSNPVNHPLHYTQHPSGIECIQITEHMGFNLGNAVKYIWRADLKHDAVEDLKKAKRGVQCDPQK